MELEVEIWLVDKGCLIDIKSKNNLGDLEELPVGWEGQGWDEE